MAGEAFGGRPQKRPGFYLDVSSQESMVRDPRRGVVAAVLAATWGPLGSSVKIDAESQIRETFGDATGTEVIRQALRGGAESVEALRVGTGGALATVTLNDGAGVPVDVVRLDAAYPGTRGNALRVTVRDSLAEAGRREVLIYDGSTLLETIAYDPGTEEAAALVAAVNDESRYLDATRLAAGSGAVQNAANQPLAGGSDPTTTGTAYADAFDAFASKQWHLMVVDSVTPSVHTSLAAYIDQARTSGLRVMAVVGEPTSVALATRFTNAAALNHPAIVYVANGFNVGDVVVAGAAAAARVAGLIASAEITRSLTHYDIPDATDIVGPLTHTEIEQAIDSGALVFSRSARRRVQIEYGITTLNDLSAYTELGDDEGWKKIRRVRTRDALMEEIAVVTDPLAGQVNNDPDGRASVQSTMQGVLDRYVDLGALDPAAENVISEDPARPPSGNSAWFIGQIVDLDSAEFIYLKMSVGFAAASAT